MNILPGNLRFGAGQPVKRLEDQRLLTGKGQFIDDKPAEGTLWLHVLRSPHAHAEIVSLDTAAATAMPGVEAVFAGADLTKDDIGTIPTLAIFKRPDGSPMTVPPRRLLAHQAVRFAGEAVAAVVATSRVLAQSAAEAIEIDYEILPSVVDPLEALKPGAPVVWPEAPDNIVAVMNYGDAAKVEEAFADAMDQASYRALLQLRSGIVGYLTQTAQPLPRLVNFEFYQVLPTLVQAYRLYADASRADELRAENNVVHPLFAPRTGVALSQ